MPIPHIYKFHVQEVLSINSHPLELGQFGACGNAAWSQHSCLAQGAGA